MRAGRSNWAFAFLVLGLGLLILVGWIVFRAESIFFRASEDLQRKADIARQAFLDVTGMEPTVVINNRIIYEQNAEILELAVLERETSVEREFTHTWMGSTKRLKVRGRFIVKAGFNLTEPFQVWLDDREVQVEIPPAGILSVDTMEVEVLEMRDGLWNRIQPSDIEEEINALRKVATKNLEREGILAQAETRLLQQVSERAENLAGKPFFPPLEP